MPWFPGFSWGSWLKELNIESGGRGPAYVEQVVPVDVVARSAGLVAYPKGYVYGTGFTTASLNNAAMRIRAKTPGGIEIVWFRFEVIGGGGQITWGVDVGSAINTPVTPPVWAHTREAQNRPSEVTIQHGNVAVTGPVVGHADHAVQASGAFESKASEPIYLAPGSALLVSGVGALTFLQGAMMWREFDSPGC